MLFDEPTSALDPNWSAKCLQSCARSPEAGMTMIVVTHEIRFARDVAIVCVHGRRRDHRGGPALSSDRQPEPRAHPPLLRMVEREEEEVEEIVL